MIKKVANSILDFEIFFFFKMPADRSKKNPNSVELDDKDAEAVADILIPE